MKQLDSEVTVTAAHSPNPLMGAGYSAPRRTFRDWLMDFSDVLESLPILRPRLVLLDFAVLALFLIH
jgi:hypothetical protein